MSSISDIASGLLSQPASVYIVIIVILLIVAGLLTAGFIYARKQAKKNKATDYYEYIVKQAERRAEEITRKASQDAREIRVETEKRASEYLSEQKSRAEEMEARFEQKLENLSASFESSFRGYENKFSEAVEKAVDVMREDLSGAVGPALDRIEDMVENTSVNLSEKASGIDQSIDSLKADYINEIRGALSKEIESSNKVVDSYRAERMNMIDNEIAMLVEKTTLLTLQKKLTAEEHADLVKQALEEAKNDGVFNN